MVKQEVREDHADTAAHLALLGAQAAQAPQMIRRVLKEEDALAPVGGLFLFTVQK